LRQYLKHQSLAIPSVTALGLHIPRHGCSYPYFQKKKQALHSLSVRTALGAA
jgi:hypothetical protein